jgi:hypothetical protein
MIKTIEETNTALEEDKTPRQFRGPCCPCSCQCYQPIPFCDSCDTTYLPAYVYQCFINPGRVFLDASTSYVITKLS